MLLFSSFFIQHTLSCGCTPQNFDKPRFQSNGCVEVVPLPALTTADTIALVSGQNTIRNELCQRDTPIKNGGFMSPKRGTDGEGSIQIDQWYSILMRIFKSCITTVWFNPFHLFEPPNLGAVHCLPKSQLKLRWVSDNKTVWRVRTAEPTIHPGTPCILMYFDA